MKPIIFNSEMVRAILDDRKTQTRRIIKPQLFLNKQYIIDYDDSRRYKEWWTYKGTCLNDKKIKTKCLYGQTSDRLWVRESFACRENSKQVQKPFWYKADGTPYSKQCGKWRPSIHMPRLASRIVLEITDIRVERIQDILPIDAVGEGCPAYHKYGKPVRGGIPTLLETRTPIEQFAKLWNFINEKRGYGFDKNPWVWVITFKKNNNLY